MNWNDKKEEKRLIWYILGFPDGVIGALSEPFVGQPSVWQWRKERKLPANERMDFRTEREKEREAEKEEFFTHLHGNRLKDTEIAKITGVAKTTIRAWRLKRGLSANAIRGGQSVQKIHKMKCNDGDVGDKKPEEHFVFAEKQEKPKKMTAKQQREKIAREAEQKIIEGLPSKEEILQMVRKSSKGRITTKKLIKRGYGDVGHSRLDQGGRGDTIHKLRELTDEKRGIDGEDEERGLLELDTSKKGQIIWSA